MPTDRELMQRVLFSLEHTLPFIEDFGDKEDVSRQHRLIADLYARLAQPEQEPVAWWHDRGDVVDLNVSGHGTPLYFAPPQREWQWLTDDEYEVMAEKYVTNCYFDTLKYARAIEAKLKEKNT